MTRTCYDKRHCRGLPTGEDQHPDDPRSTGRIGRAPDGVTRPDRRLCVRRCDRWPRAAGTVSGSLECITFARNVYRQQSTNPYTSGVSTTVRVSDETHERLVALARASGQHIQAVVEGAVAAYEADAFWAAFDAGYSRLAADKEQWAQMKSEQEGEARALADGIDES